MKQVVKMLSKDVNLNDKAITEPGVYRTHTSKHSGGGSSVETSSSHKNKSKQSLDVPAHSIYFDSAEEMLPRWCMCLRADLPAPLGFFIYVQN